MEKIEAKYQELLNTPSDINKHFPLIRRTVREGDLVVELGVREIVSTWALLANKPKALLSVDIVSPPTEKLKEVREATEENGINFSFIQDDSTNIMFTPIDVLFIDTLHLYSHLVKELFRHGEMVKRNIIFHDSVIPEMRACIQDFLFNPRWRIKEESEEGTRLLVVERI